MVDHTKAMVKPNLLSEYPVDVFIAAGSSWKQLNIRHITVHDLGDFYLHFYGNSMISPFERKSLLTPEESSRRQPHLVL
ncbi:hypothetical protein Y032_0015g2884 [Ancylostoma ceylanicum]|uniref:Uncharacterized protein n=1 Tax=Ancylostoma ceylanicum TaxID=53326 RepID=A0A016V9B3_9BILA|nr:hypothetical protein Y032_0015g2884 [Ancylostoma ceylanicum]